MRSFWIDCLSALVIVLFIILFIAALIGSDKPVVDKLGLAEPCDKDPMFYIEGTVYDCANEDKEIVEYVESGS